MEFGITTLIELKSLEDCVAFCKELDFQFVELNMNLPEYQTDKIDPRRICQNSRPTQDLLYNPS
jgi:sugar phosphate isomerase/epimerase